MENVTGNVNKEVRGEENGGEKSKPQKLLDRAREVMRLKHYSIRTEHSYIGWMRRYILFHNKRHPKQ